MTGEYLYIDMKPFRFEQDVLIVKDSNCTGTEKVMNNQIVDYILSGENTKLKLDGPPDFLKGFVRKIRKAETQKYGKQHLEIEYDQGE